MDWPSRRRWGKRCSPVSSAIYLRRRWNSYNHYSCSPNESIIMSNAQAIVDFGLRDLGYLYVETDYGWSVPHRLHNGSITWNETLFPAGFPALGNFIHNLGLCFGVYADSGIQMCMTGGVNQTGSLCQSRVARERRIENRINSALQTMKPKMQRPSPTGMRTF